VATSRSAWKRAESSLAAFFGASRRVLSGSSGRPDIDGDDGTHDRLWLESKLRASHTSWTLFRQVKAAAAKAGKIPVLGLREKHKQGCLLVIHSDDFERVAVEYLAAMGDEELLAFEHEVRVHRLGLDQEEAS
jgi:hypothetical protein